jgi:hypothetical protein
MPGRLRKLCYGRLSDRLDVLLRGFRGVYASAEGGLQDRRLQSIPQSYVIDLLGPLSRQDMSGRFTTDRDPKRVSYLICHLLEKTL